MNQLSRCTFLKSATATAASASLFYLVPRHFLGGPGYKAPSEKHNIYYEFSARGDAPPVRFTWYDDGMMPPWPAELEDNRRLGNNEGWRIWICHEYVRYGGGADAAPALRRPFRPCGRKVHPQCHQCQQILLCQRPAVGKPDLSRPVRFHPQRNRLRRVAEDRLSPGRPVENTLRLRRPLARPLGNTHAVGFHVVWFESCRFSRCRDRPDQRRQDIADRLPRHRFSSRQGLSNLSLLQSVS